MSLDKGRLRWHCRRALLELDLVLARFLEQDFDRLDDDQLQVFSELLALDDYDLWPLVNGSKVAENPRWRELIDRLRAADASRTA